MKPSEWLQSKGWTRMHPGRIADLSDWRDPITEKDYLFIEAMQIQDGREGQETKDKIIFVIQTNDEVSGLDITSALSRAGIQHTILSKILEKSMNLCAICGHPEYSHGPKGHNFRKKPSE